MTNDDANNQPKRRGRGKSRPMSERIGTLLDRTILDTLKNGELVTDADGNALMLQGKPVRIAPKAAFLEMARKRLAMLEKSREEMRIKSEESNWLMNQAKARVGMGTITPAEGAELSQFASAAKADLVDEDEEED